MMKDILRLSQCLAQITWHEFGNFSTWIPLNAHFSCLFRYKSGIATDPILACNFLSTESCGDAVLYTQSLIVGRDESNTSQLHLKS